MSAPGTWALDAIVGAGVEASRDLGGPQKSAALAFLGQLGPLAPALDRMGAHALGRFGEWVQGAESLSPNALADARAALAPALGGALKRIAQAGSAYASEQAAIDEAEAEVDALLDVVLAVGLAGVKAAIPFLLAAL